MISSKVIGTLALAVFMFLQGSYVSAEKSFITHKEEGEEAIGYTLTSGEETWNEDAVVDVSGTGFNGDNEGFNVTGINLRNTAKIVAEKNVKITVKNKKIVACGSTSATPDIFHYYMSGIYAGNGMDGESGQSEMLVKGNVDIDVGGVGLQSNLNGNITILGGGKIITHEVDADIYAMLAEEGSVFMNAGTDGKLPGGNNVEVVGNLGVISKDYGIFPNEGNAGSFVTLGLTTSSSTLRGGILNEFEENKKNPHDSGIDLYLQNGATWENKWFGATRIKVDHDDGNSDSYLYKGSKVRNLIGGESEKKAGIIKQKEDKPITVNHYKGHVKVVYEQNKNNADSVDGGEFIIKKAEEGSTITVHTAARQFHMPTGSGQTTYDKLLNVLAGKVRYEGKDGKLKGFVSVAEGLMTDSFKKPFNFKTDGQGEYKVSENTEISDTNEKKINKKNDGKVIGIPVSKGKVLTYDTSVFVNVEGQGSTEDSESEVVYGINATQGGQANFEKNLKIRLKNTSPVKSGSQGGADILHYYGSGIYAGNGMQDVRKYGHSQVIVKGNVDIETDGSAIQANQEAQVRIFGGGKIVTHDVKTFDSYALLAEEGYISMNLGNDGNTPGKNDVEIEGNLGIIHKNYGLSPVKEKIPSVVAVALTTKKSKLTGGILNEYEENGNNAQNNGIDLYLQNGATWINGWVGTKRILAQTDEREDNASYLYKGSKIRTLIGGESQENAGVIMQKEDGSITVKKYHGYEVVTYNHDGNGNVAGGDFIVKEADKGSVVALRTAGLNGLKPLSTESGDVALVNKTLYALAHKLQFTGTKGNLIGKVEIAEGLATPSVSKVITFKKDGHGEYRINGEEETEDPTDTEIVFNSGRIDGTAQGDFVKYHVWNEAEKAYVFEKNSVLNTASITSEIGNRQENNINIKANDLKLVIKSTDAFGIKAYSKDERTSHKHMNGGVNIIAKELELHVDRTAQSGEISDAAGIATSGKSIGSQPFEPIVINGNVTIRVKNKYNNPGKADSTFTKDKSGKNFTFTNGILAVNQGQVRVKGNVDIDVQAAGISDVKGDFYTHYFVNGIFAGLNYDTAAFGPHIYIDKNVKIRTNGTGIHAGSRAIVTIQGGADIEVTQNENVPNFALNAEEGTININVETSRNEAVADKASDHDTRILGNIGLINREDDKEKIQGRMIKTAVNLGLTTSQSEWMGVLIDEFKETKNTDRKKNYIRNISGLNLYLQGKAKWIHKQWGAVSVDKWTGSHVFKIHGGTNSENGGVIYQQEEKPITVKEYDGFISVIYDHDGKGNVKGGDIIIDGAKKGSGIALRTANIQGLNTTSQNHADIVLVNKTLKALANKLQYTGPKGYLTGKVEIAEGLMTPMLSKEVTFRKDGRGEYEIKSSGEATPGFQDKGNYYLLSKKGDGEIIGKDIRNGKKVILEKDVEVNVEGVGVDEYSSYNNVTGINVLNGSHLAVNGNFKLTLKNPHPAITGMTNGPDLAHYYMSGVYSGNGMSEYEPFGDSSVMIKGNVDLDVVGVALQATKHGVIKVLGGGKIITHKLDVSASYAMLSEESQIYMNTGEDGKSPGNRDVNIKGNIGVLNKNYGQEPNEGKRDGIISVGLTTKESKLEGGILNEYEENGNNPKDSGVDIYLQNGATWENGWLWTQRPEAPRTNATSYLYKGSKVRNLIGGESEEKAGIIYQNEDKDITVKNFSGHVKVIYKQNATNAKAFDGGAIRIKTAKENSQITLRSNIRDFQKPSGENADYDALLNTLAGKLYYEAKDNHLTAQAEIAESLTTPAYAKKISFKTADGQGEVKAGTTPGQRPGEGGTTPGQTPGEGGTTPGQTPGEGGTTPGQRPGEGGTTPGQTPGEGGTTPGQDPNFETSAMKGIRSAMVSTGMISTGAFWSAQNNDVERRMGDIRLARTETGLWAKYQGGSSEYNDTDSREKAVHVDQTYNAIQVGYDKSVGDWIVGGTFSYGTTKDKYIDNRDTGKLNGTGKETGFNGGVYGTLKQKDGSYFDIIAKVGQIKNNYEVYTKDWDKDKKNDDKVNSEYKVNGTSLSVEYGKRIEREGFYVEPSMELTVNRVVGHSEEVTSEVHKYKMKITQDDMTSVVGRIGVGIGQNYENGHIYGKLSLAHEFNGDIMTTFSAGNKEEVVKLSLRGTWLDVEMGGSYRLSKDSYFYGSFTKNFGAKLNNKWRLDAGIRLAF